MDKSPQQLRWRALWFAVGAILNYLLIATPFRWLTLHTTLPVWAISACSVGVATAFFFVWNFFVNFKTASRVRTVLPRYVATVTAMWLVSTAVLTALKQFDAGLSLAVGPLSLDADVVGTQVALAGVKFVLYHKWVFPS